MKRLLSVMLVVVMAIVVWAAVGTSPIDASYWEPPDTVRRSGVWAPNEALFPWEVTPTPGFHAPEDVAIDKDGFIYTGVAEGKILRWDAKLTTMEVFADTGGRPLGLAFAPDGRLLVADAERGLLAVNAQGEVSVLVDEVAGVPVHFADDVDVTAQGLVVFSDASSVYGFHNWKLDIFENRPHGRLLTYDLATGASAEVANGFYFANGVAVSLDGRYALVSETSRYRVRKVWLAGPLKGTSELFVDGLPGFPDGISRAPREDRFWIAIPSPRNKTVDALAGNPRLRGLVARLPPFLQPAPTRHPMVVQADGTGAVLSVLEDSDGSRFAVNTSVEEHDGWLYLGSLVEEAWARVPVPKDVNKTVFDAGAR